MPRSYIDVCVSCGSRRPIRSKGVCYGCYAPSCFGPGVCKKEDLAWSEQDNTDDRPLSKPTSALPGTEDKITILHQRATSGHHLWHPNDATYSTA